MFYNIDPKQNRDKILDCLKSGLLYKSFMIVIYDSNDGMNG